MTRREPDLCVCGRMETLHPMRGGRRGAFPAAGCTGYTPANVIQFPGVGTAPAPGPRPAPADLDGMGERYVAYCEARDTPGRERDADLLARAVADDTPAWLGEVARVEALRAELAAELDRIRGGA